MRAGALVLLLLMVTACGSTEIRRVPYPVYQAPQIIKQLPDEKLTRIEQPPAVPAPGYTQADIAEYIPLLLQWGCNGWSQVAGVAQWAGRELTADLFAEDGPCGETKQ